MKQEDIIKTIVKIIKNDGLVILPTDTIYGICCSIYSEKAIDKIYKIKKRSTSKPLSILAASLEQISKFAVINENVKEIIANNDAGSVTLVCNLKPGIKFKFTNKNNTIGFRIPNHELCLKLINKLGMPIVATSVNISDQAHAIRYEDIDAKILAKVNYSVCMDNCKGIASKVIDVSRDEVLILR